MTALAFFATADAALALVETLTPQIEALVQKGEISREQQTALKARLDNLRASAAFTGAEWEVSGRATAAPTPATGSNQS
jgi:hypothetical protein